MWSTGKEKSKKMKKKKDANWQRTKPMCKVHMSIFVPLNYEHFSPSFHPILGRKYFGELEEKIYKPY